MGRCLNMRYWGYLGLKLLGGGLVSWGVYALILATLPKPQPFFMGVTPPQFSHDVSFTFGMLLFSLFCAGLLYVILWDQRYRCRICARKLRMPMTTGSWTHVLLGAPRTEYICPYGHGTLKVSELQITGSQPSDWQQHEDMWKELVSLDKGKQ